METERILIARGIVIPPWHEGVNVELEVPNKGKVRVLLTETETRLIILGLGVEKASEIAEAIYLALQLARSRKL